MNAKELKLTGDEISLIKEALEQLKMKREQYGSEVGKQRIDDLLAKIND